MSNTKMNVPFLDLKSQYFAHKEQFDNCFSEVCSNSSFILGPQVAKFEQDFASFLGSEHCVSVATGTDALIMAFKALGIGKGDEVLMPAHTFVATTIGIMECGARPVLVDVNPETYLIDTKKLEAALTPKTKAICPVHLYGRACNMDEVMSFANKHGLLVVEDAAQSHGASWKGRVSGTFGDVGCYSFYPGKNLGAYGDGGAICTSSEKVAAQVRKLRNYGSEIKYQHPEKGTNSRLDSIQAAVLSVKLQHLKEWNKKRWNAAQTYWRELEDLHGAKLQLPELASPEEHVFHLFVIQVDDRDKVMKFLGDNGVQTGIHYPVPFYLQGGYAELGYKEGSFPITEKLAARIVSLPMFPELSAEQIKYTCDKLRQALA